MKHLHAVLVSSFALFGSQSLAQTPVDRGEEIFQRCKTCHQIGAGAENRVGPDLTGVVGRSAASVAGFRYSTSLRAAADAGLVWNAGLLDAWLTDTTAFLKARLDDPEARSKMTFRLANGDDRAAVIAYLGRFPAAAAVPPNGFCVENASEATYVFITETREGARQLAELAPGERLCAEGTDARNGIVGVFETADSLEGCSRLIDVGQIEQFLEYAEFDRCLWGAHRS